MKLTLQENAKKDIFLAMFQLFKNTSEYLHLIFKEDQFYVQGMDRSHICLFEIKLASDWFTEYYVQKSDVNHICIPSLIFSNVLATCSQNHTLDMYYEGNPDKLNLDFVVKSKEAQEFSHSYVLPLVENDCDLLDVTESTFDVDFSISSKKIVDVCSKLVYFGDTMHIVCDEEHIEIKSDGTNGEMKVNIDIDDLSEFSINEGETIDLFYNLNFVQKMCLTTKLSQEIQFGISKEAPMRMKYDLGDNNCVQIFIAPKVDNE